eukprot:3997703-Pyramimonas_sp.AAC.1
MAVHRRRPDRHRLRGGAAGRPGGQCWAGRRLLGLGRRRARAFTRRARHPRAGRPAAAPRGAAAGGARRLGAAGA